MDYPGKVITKNQVTPTQISATGVWTLDDAAAATRNNNWPVAGVPNPISKSLRFNSADSAYLNRTPASAGNRRTWTYSCWVKLSSIANGFSFISQYTDGNNQSLARITGSSVLRFYDFVGGSFVAQIIWSPVYRDLSAWYHLMLVADTTQATDTNRIKFYMNGVQVTSTSTATWPAQNTDLRINLNGAHFIGQNGAGGDLADGYLTEINFIDGQALTPSSFGMTDPVTGVWEPLKYSGTYGTNGFYLNFKDATSTTTLGLDYSGNSNTWTTNNFSVTAGVGNDSLTDVPTPWIVYNTTGDVGGVVRGNYATLNPIDPGSVAAPTNGNLDQTLSGTNGTGASGSMVLTTGKWYWEVSATATTNAAEYVGVIRGALPSTAGPTTNPSGFYYGASGNNREDGTTVTYGNTWSVLGTTYVIGVALDCDANTAVFYLNGVSQGTRTLPSTTSGWKPQTGFNSGSGSATMIHNFGQRPFAYTPPSGFLSLCTTNLPASTVLKGSEYMNVVTYAGSASQQTIDSNLSILDFAWIKNRTAARDHIVVDTVRGGSPMLTLYPSFTYADDNTSPNYNPTSISGSSIVLGGAKLGINNSGENFVLWGWNAGGSTVTNTSGTISAQVRASTTSGFSIVTYTGTGSNATVGHGLGVAPSMIIVKIRNTTDGWFVYNKEIGNTKYLRLNTTDAAATFNLWQSTSPTSTVFSIATDPTVNGSGNTYVAYCFAPISGFSAFGSYTGNGSTDGPFVYLGFRPRYVLIKRTDSASAVGWFVWDTTRGSSSGGNVVGYQLYPNLSNSESSSSTNLDILSNGFKLRDTYQDFNASGGTFIYMSFAENPFKNALAR